MQSVDDVFSASMTKPDKETSNPDDDDDDDDDDECSF